MLHHLSIEAVAKPSAHLVGSRVPRDRGRAGRASLPGFATAFIVLLLILCAFGAERLQSRNALPSASDGVAATPAPSPQADLAVALLGGFRSIAAEIVWFRADRLQDSGRYAEMAQLAAWLTFLEPHTPEVWSYAAWNLAYNISVMMQTPADRWRWVEAGLKLLRDDGLRLNPGEPALHREIAWLFLAKIGGKFDDASPYYREAWKHEVENVQKTGDWSTLGLDPAQMAAIDSEYGAQDWTHPYASAIYWAKAGLRNTNDIDARRELRHLIINALILQTTADPKVAPYALKEMRAAQVECPSSMLKDIMARFGAKFGIKAGK